MSMFPLTTGEKHTNAYITLPISPQSFRLVRRISAADRHGLEFEQFDVIGARIRGLDKNRAIDSQLVQDLSV